MRHPGGANRLRRANDHSSPILQQYAKRRRLAPVIEHNIAAIEKHRQEAEAHRTRQERAADWIAWFSGSMPFVYFHAAWFTFWIALNLGLFGLPVFDPFPYGLLTMIVSLEAIFLSTFVLVSQNRQATLADRRAELDLQTNLLAEHEVTRALCMLDAIAAHLGIDAHRDPEIKELESDVEPDKVLTELEAHEQNGSSESKSKQTNGERRA